MQKKCETLSDEFLIKAKLTALKFENPNRFNEACQYYKDSIELAPRFNNIFENALYLQNHNQNREALFYYELILNKYFNDIDISLKAMTLNNLAVLQKNMNENKKAERNYEEALRIRRELAEKNPETYIADVAQTLNNLANLQSNMNENKKAERNYEEALRIRRELVKKNPETYLSHVADTLNNLAILQSDMNENKKAERNYEEALIKYRELAEKNPEIYIPYVARTLNNLAILQSDMNENKKAERNYEEALVKYRELAGKNPETYMADVAMTLINYSVFYLQALKNINKAKDLCLEALSIVNHFIDLWPSAKKYKEMCFDILLTCGMDLEDLE